MKMSIRFVTPAVALAILSIAPAFVHAQASQTQKQNQTQKVAAEDWNTPPAGTEQAQQGYRDGVQAAQLDLVAKRKIDAQSSHLYLHPPVKSSARDEYRSSFVQGYQAALKHTSSGGGE
jgi:hypothetical protein